MFHQLVYASHTTQKMGDEDLNSILESARRNNAKIGVTGMLLYIDQNFLQILEGEEAAVNNVYRQIASDPRHSAISVLARRSAPERLFEGWSMGFERVNKDTAPDAFAISKEAVDGAIDPARAIEIAILLRNFYRINSGHRAGL